MRGGPGSADPGRLVYSNVPLISIVMAAYDVRTLVQIEGPGWIRSERFDLTATMPPDTTNVEMQGMLRGLLAERFHVTEHEITKGIDGYEMSVAKDGPKPKPPGGADFEQSLPPSFRELTPGAQNLLLLTGSLTTSQRDYLARRGATMAQLAEQIPLDGPVLDKTGVTGEHSYYVEFAPPNLAVAAGADDQAPDIFAAFQEQLGLKLERKKIPMRTIVIDRLERIPERN